jgi:peptidoglycan hydrolase-like protein with peptidoglycan-binding domain
VSDYPTLHEGGHNDEMWVIELQQRLQGLNLYMDGRVDGIFGPKTAHAVREFQRMAGLHVDGIAGHHTFESLGNSQLHVRAGDDHGVAP